MEGDSSSQPSAASRERYWYPASRIPDVTSASAISFINFSLTLQPNLFQLFQPIGGVLANPLSSERARAAVADEHTAIRRHRSQHQRRNFTATFIQNPSEILNRVASADYARAGKSLRISITLDKHPRLLISFSLTRTVMRPCFSRAQPGSLREDESGTLLHDLAKVFLLLNEAVCQ